MRSVSSPSLISISAMPDSSSSSIIFLILRMSKSVAPGLTGAECTQSASICPLLAASVAPSAEKRWVRLRDYERPAEGLLLVLNGLAGTPDCQLLQRGGDLASSLREALGATVHGAHLRQDGLGLGPVQLTDPDRDDVSACVGEH